MVIALDEFDQNVIILPEQQQKWSPVLHPILLHNKDLDHKHELSGQTNDVSQRVLPTSDNDDQDGELEAELLRLKQEHRDLDAAIEALEQMNAGDQLQVQRLKKRKLFIRDRIKLLENRLTPDIIA